MLKFIDTVLQMAVVVLGTTVIMLGIFTLQAFNYMLMRNWFIVPFSGGYFPELSILQAYAIGTIISMMTTATFVPSTDVKKLYEKAMLYKLLLTPAVLWILHTVVNLDGLVF